MSTSSWLLGTFLAMMAPGILIGQESKPQAPSVTQKTSPTAAPQAPKGIRLRWYDVIDKAPVTEERQLIEWNTLGEEVERRLGRECYVSDWAGEDLCVLATQKYGGWFADFGDELHGAFPATLYFFDGKFFRTLVDVRPEHFGVVEETLTRALGKAKKKESSNVKNRMGAEFDQEIRIWEFSEVDVYLLKRGAYVDKGLLSISYKPVAKLAEKKENNASAPF